jgi:hypothetical protein
MARSTRSQKALQCDSLLKNEIWLETSPWFVADNASEALFGFIDALARYDRTVFGREALQRRS